MKKVLLILAHPELKNSLANKTIINEVKNLKNVQIRDLASLYPDFVIDVEAEQKELLGADLIIFQHPFYWYNVPPILKQWMDKVLSYGFAYGSTGDKLKGKDFLLSITIGGPEDSYSPEGYNNFTISELLTPLKQTSNLAGMNFLEPIKSHDMIFIPGVYNKKEEVEARAKEHAKKLIDFIGKY